MLLQLLFAITIGTVQTQADARLAVIWPNVQTVMNNCLASSDLCFTNWSTTNQCNTVTADSVVCQMTQVDQGLVDSCNVDTGQQKFSAYGITLPATDIFRYRLNSYSGPGGKGVQVCARLQFEGTIYERCQANGPQASAFTQAWHAVIP